MEKVAPGVWRGGTRFVNWYAVDAGADGLTLIDAGLPGYRKHLDASLHEIGKTRDDVGALILTHGHIDHIGMAAPLAASGTRILMHPADRDLAADPRTNKTDSSLLPYLRWPVTWAFLAHCVAEGAARPPAMPDSTELQD